MAPRPKVSRHKQMLVVVRLREAEVVRSLARALCGGRRTVRPERRPRRLRPFLRSPRRARPTPPSQPIHAHDAHRPDPAESAPARLSAVQAGKCTPCARRRPGLCGLQCPVGFAPARMRAPRGARPPGTRSSCAPVGVFPGTRRTLERPSGLCGRHSGSLGASLRPLSYF
ncbi:unnamed protein product [Rangifer tarandus platyrhynchus]|uniref:Uncharacterized protein n=2 Tax=Rangifer tarandus platyrhynchus TaxID=3082113 RepID=A0ABN8Y3H6_RANTA|nr:unnamed protein product [Rangifer tarandus platyrhynchus]CAI9692601.1 unnamed protein product [Rangifer tarandus platyrhynchus]